MTNQNEKCGKCGHELDEHIEVEQNRCTLCDCINEPLPPSKGEEAKSETSVMKGMIIPKESYARGYIAGFAQGALSREGELAIAVEALEEISKFRGDPYCKDCLDAVTGDLMEEANQALAKLKETK